MKRYMNLLILMILCLLTGCGTAEEAFGDTLNLEERSGMYDMEAWERELLSKTYQTELEKEHIQSGELYEHQARMLLQVRSVLAYLHQKYAGHTFEIGRIELPDINAKSIQYVCIENSSKDMFSVIAPDDQSTVFKDNYYAELIGKDYDALLTDILKERGVSVVAVSTQFPSLLGNEIETEMQAEAVLKTGQEIPRDTTIYLVGDDLSDIDQVQSCIMEREIYGIYWIYCSTAYHEGMNAEECWEIWKSTSENVKTTMFQYNG